MIMVWLAVLILFGVLFDTSVIAPLKAAKEEKERDEERRKNISQKKWK